MQHQEGCPLETQLAVHRDIAARGGDLLGLAAEEQLHETSPCPDRRCSTWLDLSVWFSYNRSKLSAEDFQQCFTGSRYLCDRGYRLADIGHGGHGVYERLAVLGGKALEMMSKLYIAEKYSPYGVPFDLHRDLPEGVLRRLWTLKRVERVVAERSLHLFGKTYLATAQVSYLMMMTTR